MEQLFQIPRQSPTFFSSIETKHPHQVQHLEHNIEIHYAKLLYGSCVGRFLHDIVRLWQTHVHVQRHRGETRQGQWAQPAQETN